MSYRLIVLLFIGLTAVAHGQPLQLVTGDGYQPYTDQSLPLRGMVTEIVERAFAAVGENTKIDFRPWKRGYEGTKKGLYAGTFPYIKTEERERDFYYSQSIHPVYVRMFVHRDSEFHTLQDLKGRRICIPLGYATNEQFRSFLQENAIRRDGNPTDLATCFQLLSFKRMDFVVINEVNGWTTIENAQLEKASFRTLDEVLQEDGHYLIVSRAHPDAQRIISQFNKGLQRLTDQGALQEIIDRHMAPIVQ